MHYVILRDDDTCALTPAACLERLYAPFLERGLPVNLAVIPEVRADARRPDGRREGFLRFKHETTTPRIPIGRNQALVSLLHQQPLFHVAQHGCEHIPFEFDCDRREAARRIAAGAHRLAEAGLPTPHAFVAPHDRFSAGALQAAAARFPVISTGWFNWRRVPPQWWVRYAFKRLLRRPHWSAGGTLLLSHPGCLLSRNRPLEAMLEAVGRQVRRERLTVLVTHWWEYFGETRPDEDFIAVLHRTAEFLAAAPDIRVISFADLATGRVELPEREPAAAWARAEQPGRHRDEPPAGWTGADRWTAPAP
ncbi:MAG TPA: DUF2334 domain-containing protein [Lacunisphaera sp.]|jgi:hypothetical protein|nr:DUF2334 domain-containing protein [Lacunisphaera sp.]